MSGDKSKSLFGLLVVFVGVVLLLNNLDITDVNIVKFWPVLLIFWGFSALLTGSRNPGAQGISLFVILLGVLFLANSMGWADIDIGSVLKIILPVLIILFGASLFFGRTFAGKSTMAVLGGVERGKTEPWDFESGSYFAFMGGIDLDLRHAVIPEGESFLDLTAFMGGIEIRVPADLPVEADGFAVLGGIELFGKGSGGIVGSARNKQNVRPDSPRVLKIQGRAVMGGIDVKRV